MASGKDLLEAFKKLGIPGAENLDGDAMDWYFEQPETAEFLQKFISGVESGQLKNTAQHKTSQKLKKSMEGSASQSVPIEEKISETKMSISHKKSKVKQMKAQLKLLQDQNAKQSEWNASLKTLAARNDAELSKAKQELLPIEKSVSESLKTLATACDHLKSVLAEANEETEASNVRKHRADGTSTSQNEEYFQAEQNFHVKAKEATERITTERKPNPEFDKLLEEWRTELARLQHCFTLDVKSYSILTGNQLSLENQLKFLCNVRDNPSNLIVDIGKAESTLQGLNAELSEAMEKLQSSAHELAAKETLPILLVNYTFKLQRMEQFTKEQEKVLHILRQQQCRLNLFKLISKLDAERFAQFSELCRTTTNFLEEGLKLPQQRIDVLENLLQEQAKAVTPFVSSGDFVMETIADVFDADREELLRSFDSIADAVKSFRSKVDLDQALLIGNRKQILEGLSAMSATVEFLSSLQSPLTADTSYLGNVQLAAEISKLERTLDSFKEIIEKSHRDFSEKQQVLVDCPREVFERNKKIREVLE